MGIFDKLLDKFKLESTREIERASIEEDPKEIDIDAQTIYFKDGKMYKVSPTDEESWYDARYLVSDTEMYDLENVKSIQSIKVPDFGLQNDFEGYGVKGSLDYVLRMKAGNLFNRNEKELCSVCLWKATELMFANKYMGWKKKDFDRLVNWHYELGMPETAEKAKEYLKSKEYYTKSTFDRCAEETKNIMFKNAITYQTDLVAFHDYGSGCCEECAKLRGRVYSISGRNKKFPKLPEYAKQHGNFHPGCRCMMSSYFENEEEIFYKSERVDAIKASNRPWKDDRDEREKKLYIEYLQRMENEKLEEKRLEEYNIQKGKDRKEYEEILKKLPSIAPKSLTGYRRMKTMQSKNFMKIYELAKEKGIKIEL